MLENISIFDNDVKALINEFGILLTIDEIPDLLSANWMFPSEFMQQIFLLVDNVALNNLKS